MKVVFVVMGAAAFALAGCATVELTPAAQNVKVISAEQAKACKFVDAVSTTNSNTLVSDPEADARGYAMNKIAEKGGNALLIKATDFKPSPSGVGGMFSLTGEAYICP